MASLQYDKQYDRPSMEKGQHNSQLLFLKAAKNTES